MEFSDRQFEFNKEEHMKVKTSVLIIVLSLTVAISYANVTTPTIVLHGMRVIDGNSMQPIENATMVIKGDRIVTVTNKKIAVPKKAKKIDLTGKTIIPTLITTHSHLGLLKGTKTTDSNNTPENVLHQMKKYADYGVGVVTSLGRDQTFIYDLRKKRDTQKISGNYAYLFTAGQGIGVQEGAPPALNAGPDPVYRPTTVAEAKRDIAELAKHKPDLVKIWVDNWWGAMPKMKPDIYYAVISEAHKHGLRVAAHIYYLADAKKLVNDGVDILEHSVRDLPVDDELINAMRSHHTAIVPTLDLDEAYFIYAENPAWMNTAFFKNALEPGVWKMIKNQTYQYKENEREVLALAEKNIQALHKAGVSIGFGTDSGATPVRVQGFAEHRELQLLVDSGFTPMEALMTATRDSAKLLKVADTMGTLQAGKKANFIVLDANPIDDIANTEKINSVWLDGKPHPKV